MDIRTAPVASGEIIYDASRWAAEPASRAFAHDNATHAERRGRGDVRFLQLSIGQGVLRRYQRGGLMARWSRDWYLWRGRQQTRPFREFQLTALLRDAGLPVPHPLAARYLRAGLGYRAELITERVVGARTLAERIAAGEPIDWPGLGSLIARFHRHGLWHADLNAHNLIIDDDGKIWMIDFDRGRIRVDSPGWKRANLDRLLRSLRKLGADRSVSQFEAVAWPQLRVAHAAG